MFRVLNPLPKPISGAWEFHKRIGIKNWKSVNSLAKIKDWWKNIWKLVQGTCGSKFNICMRQLKWTDEKYQWIINNEYFLKNVKFFPIFFVEDLKKQPRISTLMQYCSFYIIWLLMGYQFGKHIFQKQFVGHQILFLRLLAGNL